MRKCRNIKECWWFWLFVVLINLLHCCSSNQESKEAECSNICGEIKKIREKDILANLFSFIQSSRQNRHKGEKERSNLFLEYARHSLKNYDRKDLWLRAIISKDIATEYYKNNNMISLKNH